MLLVDITIVNVALPSIQRELDASLTGLQWVVDAYAITLAALILTAGALADRYGRRLLFAIGVALFTAWPRCSAASAWNIASLDVARALQGVGGAALFADGARADRRRVPGPRARGRDRDLGRDDRRRRRVRAARRRHHHAMAELALGLLRERPDRRSPSS